MWLGFAKSVISNIVELKFFGGISLAEAANVVL